MLNKDKFSCLTVDVDPLAVYYRNRNLSPGAGVNMEAVYHEGLPRWRELLGRLGIKATFFITGREAMLVSNRKILAALVADGHELASHSFSHPADFADLDEEALVEEIARAEKAIGDIAGVPVQGFRAPGWNFNPKLFRVLEARGYRYDSSLMPLWGYRRFFGALHLKERLSAGRVLDGRSHWLLRRQFPYRVDLGRPTKSGESRLVEIPCGFCRWPPCPLNFTTALWLGAKVYGLLARTVVGVRAPLVFVAHGIDLVDFEKSIADRNLVRKPGLDLPLEEKAKQLEAILSVLGQGRRWATASELALTVLDC